MMSRNRDPKSKEELLDRMLSFDFDGDIRHLGPEPAKLSRTGVNRLTITFPRTGRTFELEVHIPRELNRPAEARSFARDNTPPFPEVELEATIKAEDKRKTRRAQQPHA